MTFNNDPSKRPYGAPDWLGETSQADTPHQTEAMPAQGFGHGGFGPSNGNYGQPQPQGRYGQPQQANETAQYQQPVATPAPQYGGDDYGSGQFGPAINAGQFNRPVNEYDKRPQRTKKKSGGLVPGCLISILVAVVVLLGVAEFGTRWALSAAVQQGMVEAAKSEGVDINKEDAQVSFGRSSVLYGFATGKLGTVDVKTPSTLRLTSTSAGEKKMVGTPKMDIHVKDLGIRNLDNPTFGELDLSLLMSDQNLLEMMEASASQSDMGAAGKLVEVTKVTTNDDQDTVDVELTSGLAVITFKPTVENGNLKMNVENVNVVGISLGEEVAKALGDQFSNEAKNLNNGMEFTDVQVNNGELEVSLHGTDLTMDQLTKK